MSDIYARIVLWLIRPALELCAPKVDPGCVKSIVLDDIRHNGDISRSLRASVFQPPQSSRGR